ncbi:GNAT family N-acetyltransferase [Halomarina salina]|uniref:GNAT family N-acetyltransferase n=1 Tax=Halomarina salina TaxID=1872699 RepID=A0ABD5RQS8_9EURY|nr:GNAT family N-acetyltransferase [Halomarina salina]
MTDERDDGRVVVATTDAQRADALAVRRAVFVEEQDVPESLELDDHDEDPTTDHLVAYDGDDAVGAARLRPYDEGSSSESVGKVQRVAVVADRRGEDWGRRLMTSVEELARERGYERLVLDVQTHARGFYEALGYVVVDETEFLDAGIPHVGMEKRLQS